jgi:molybdopterin synthase sulfur carrier subunit
MEIFLIMPKIKVKLFANIREFTGTKELEVDSGTVIDVLIKINKKFPGFEKMIFDGENIKPYVNIFLNGKNVFDLDGLKTELRMNDEIAVFPPVSGG